MHLRTRLQRVAVLRPLSKFAAFGPRPLVRCLFILTLLASAFAFAPVARAVEMQVEGLQDSLLGPPDDFSLNHCTLRKAINNANDNLATYPQCQAGEVGNDTIVFNLPGTITFALAGINEDGGETGDLDITDSLTIIGHPDGTIINAADLDRIFDIHPGVTVTLRNIHITNGTGLGGGGALWLRGATLNLENCTVSNSYASGGDGGAIIMTESAVLNMTNSTVTGNIAAHHAGAIVVDSGSANANITNSTITGNSSQTGLSGGLRNLGTVTLRSTIVAGNTNASPLNYIPNLDGTYASLGYNVIGDLGAQVGNPTFVAQPTDQVNVTNAQVNLGPLASNGGPTPTHALLPGSVAIDKGHGSGSTTDQRGLTRPCDDPAIANATLGDGGDAGAFEVQVVCSSNSAPNAADDAAGTNEETPVVINVLSNDTDPDGDTLSVASVTQGSNGSVTNNGDGTVTYTPNANFFGTDTFTYTIDDGNSASDTATVTVNVANVQDAPTANDDATTVAEDSGANAVNVLANDTDADGNSLTVDSVTQGASGSVAITGGGTGVSYTPNPNFNGTDSFTYTVSDGNGGTDTATVSVTVTPVNDAPTANDDGYTTNSNTPLNVPPPGVLSNDTDIDGDTLTAQLVSGPSNASAFALNPNGSFSYTPNLNYTGTDSFTYRAFDGSANSNAATVTINVLDTVPPVLTSSVASGSLWPPNHDLVNVGLNVSATDNSGDPVNIQVFVFSDEDDLATGSGNHSPDAKDIAPGTLRLRAERSGDGDGRVYLIVVVATDSSGNVSRKCHTVVVPKSQSQASRNAVAQQAQAALAHCAGAGTPPPGYYVVGDGPIVGPKQ